MGGIISKWVDRMVDGAPADDEEGGDRPASSLFECPACDAVYVGTDPQSCPECGSPVERVPNERELGITGGDVD